MAEEIKAVYWTNPYLITVALIYQVITALAIVLHIKFRKQLGNWSKVILALIVVVNSIHFYLRNRILGFENLDRDFNHNSAFSSLIWLKGIFDQLSFLFALFMFNIVFVKVYFIQKILESYNSLECDLLKKQVTFKIKIMIACQALYTLSLVVINNLV